MRNNVKYAGMKAGYNLKTRTEEIQDIDYFHKLNPAEKQWMNNFMEEWVNANTQHEGKRFHKSKKDRKIIYDRNNARNRDAFTQAKTQNVLDYFEQFTSKKPTDIRETEDEMVTKYDLAHGDREQVKEIKREYKGIKEEDE